MFGQGRFFGSRLVEFQPGFNYLGIDFRPAISASGLVDTVSVSQEGSTVADLDAGFTSILDPKNRYGLEITSGDGIGLISEVVLWTETSVTVRDDFSTMLSESDSYQIRQLWTLRSLFGENIGSDGEPLFRGGSPAVANIIHVGVGGQIES